MKKTIGIFLESEPTGGGIFQYTLAILDALLALPDQEFFIVIAYQKPQWKEWLKNLEIKNSDSVAIFEFKNHFLGRFIGKLLTFFKLPIKWWRRLSPLFHGVAYGLASKKCDLWIFPSQSGWTYQSPVKSIGVIHDLMHRYEGNFDERKSLFYLHEKSYFNICKWSEAILVDSYVGMSQVQECYGTSSNKIYVLPYITPRYIFNQDIFPDFETLYNLPSRYFFYPAQFWQHKNHKNLILAFNLIKDNFTDMNLVFSGSKKNAYAEVMNLIRDLSLEDRVFYIGYVPNEHIAQIYIKSQALIMPTFWGPTNIPPLEAMAVGCPVAVSDIYGMREQLGDASLFFDPKSPEDISKSMINLWTNNYLREDLVVKGKKLIQNWNQCTFNKRFFEIIDKVLKSYDSNN